MDRLGDNVGDPFLCSVHLGARAATAAAALRSPETADLIEAYFVHSEERSTRLPSTMTGVIRL